MFKIFKPSEKFGFVSCNFATPMIFVSNKPNYFKWHSSELFITLQWIRSWKYNNGRKEDFLPQLKHLSHWGNPKTPRTLARGCFNTGEVLAVCRTLKIADILPVGLPLLAVPQGSVCVYQRGAWRVILFSKRFITMISCCPPSRVLLYCKWRLGLPT